MKQKFTFPGVTGVSRHACKSSQTAKESNLGNRATDTVVPSFAAVCKHPREQGQC